MKLPMDLDSLMASGARLISNLWAATWISFGLASGISQGLTVDRIAFDLAISSLFFVLLQCLARRRTILAGLLLSLFGLTLVVILPILSGHLHGNGLAFVVLTMALPPLVAGIMVIMDWHSRNSSVATHAK